MHRHHCGVQVQQGRKHKPIQASSSLQSLTLFDDRPLTKANFENNLLYALSFYWTIYLSNHLSIEPSFYLSNQLTMYQTSFLSIKPSIYLSKHLSIYQTIYLSIYWTSYLSNHLYIYLTIFLLNHLSIYQTSYLSIK